MSKTAYTALRTRASVGFSALFLSAVVLVAGSVTAFATLTAGGSLGCTMCGG